jgi:hypothetical protein
MGVLAVLNTVKQRFYGVLLPRTFILLYAI